jgi:hypothetical protein
MGSRQSLYRQPPPGAVGKARIFAARVLALPSWEMCFLLFCRFASCIAATKAHICIYNRNPHIYHTNPYIIHNHNIHHPSSRTNATSNIQQVAQVQHPSSNIQQSSKGVQHNKVTTSIIQQHEGTEPLTRPATSRHHRGVRSSLSTTKTTRTV